LDKMDTSRVVKCTFHRIGKSAGLSFTSVFQTFCRCISHRGSSRGTISEK
jgi:hypothetical protein